MSYRGPSKADLQRLSNSYLQEAPQIHTYGRPPKIDSYRQPPKPDLQTVPKPGLQEAPQIHS